MTSANWVAIAFVVYAVVIGVVSLRLKGQPSGRLAVLSVFVAMTSVTAAIAFGVLSVGVRGLSIALIGMCAGVDCALAISRVAQWRIAQRRRPEVQTYRAAAPIESGQLVTLDERANVRPAALFAGRRGTPPREPGYGKDRR